MESRNIKDLFSGAALVAFGLYVIIDSARFNYMTDDGPGPGFLPLWLGIGITALALCLIAVNLLRPQAKLFARPRSWNAEARALSGWLALMGAALLLPFLGLILSLALLTFFLIAIMERRSLWSAVAVALGLGIGFHLIFVTALGVSFPQSPFGF